MQTLRGDRIFRAGEEPGSVAETHLWIVDYKTARHGTSGLDAFLQSEKQKYLRQLEAYAEVMRRGSRGELNPSPGALLSVVDQAGVVGPDRS